MSFKKAWATRKFSCSEIWIVPCGVWFGKNILEIFLTLDIRSILKSWGQNRFMQAIFARAEKLLYKTSLCILWANLLPVSDRNLCDLSTVTNLLIFWKDLYLNLVSLLAYQRKRFHFAFDIFILFMMTSLYSIGYIRKDKENYQLGWREIIFFIRLLDKYKWNFINLFPSFCLGRPTADAAIWEEESQLTFVIFFEK